jgi:DNA-binding CsgD family transcriptional regulator
VRAELRRSLRDFYREASPHNPPPASTKSDRLKAGKDPGGLKRVHVIYDRKGFPHDPLTDPETLIKAGYYTEAPGSDGEIEMNAMMESLTPLQRNVVGCMHAGMSERQIAESFGTTRNQVRKLIEIVRRRLDK